MITVKIHNALLVIMISILSISLSSCKEMLNDLLDDPNALHVEVCDGSGINTPEDGTEPVKGTRVSYSGFTTTFDEGDAIGVYAFDGSKYVNSNVKYTKQADGTWLPESKVVYSPNYTYYAYFPYSENAYTPSTGDGDVETKFADFISDTKNYFWKADQFSKANFTTSNLMLASASANSDRSVKFTMMHERGLAVISNPANKWYYSTDEKITYPCTTVFTKNIPYTLSGTNYYLVKPDSVTSIAGLPLKITKGKYMIPDIKLTGTPSYTYSTSLDDGKTWSSYSSTKPSWLTITPKGEEDMTTNFSNAVPEVPVPTADERNSVLKNNSPVTDYDLSMHNNDGTARTGRTTANCYLVHAPGTYRIPLVYGNAIKDGKGNPSAYHTTQTSNTLQNFKNHKDEGIYTGDDTKDPWIKNHGITVDGAKLIWQDVKGLISDVGVNGDYLTFSVSKDNIDEGNALIAATENGTVVWSWQVWVTKETLAASELTAINTGAHTYKVAAVNVGEHLKWKTNMCRVRATSNNVTIQYEVSSLNNQEYGTEPYYQWGRKEPEPPSGGGYQMDGSTFRFGYIVRDVSVGTTIRFPSIHSAGGASSLPYEEDSNYNCWDANQTGTGNISTATVKTVYDPCPPNYCVPTGNLYYYMGQNSSYTKWINNNREIGRIWTKDGANLFFPASGHRAQYYGVTVNVGTDGACWSATTERNSIGIHLGFNSSGWNYYPDNKSHGFPVRPVLEE